MGLLERKCTLFESTSVLRYEKANKLSFPASPWPIFHLWTDEDPVASCHHLAVLSVVQVQRLIQDARRLVAVQARIDALRRW